MGRAVRNGLYAFHHRGLSMWICERCGEIFDEPESVKYCYEDYNGVSSMFKDRHYGYYSTCPECGSEYIERYHEESEDEEE